MQIHWKIYWVQSAYIAQGTALKQLGTRHRFQASMWPPLLPKIARARNATMLASGSPARNADTPPSVLLQRLAGHVSASSPNRFLSIRSPTLRIYLAFIKRGIRDNAETLVPARTGSGWGAQFTSISSNTIPPPIPCISFSLMGKKALFY